MAKIDKLIQKRARLDAEIEAAKALEQRKSEVLRLLENSKILSLSDAILRTEFEDIAIKHRAAGS
jgi:hypothetical protein